MQRIARKICRIALSLAILLSLMSLRNVHGQVPVTAPPDLLILVHQAFRPEARSERERLDTEIAQACRQLEVPNQWIDLEAITGEPERLSFDPFESFAQVDDAFSGWGKINASHPELARMQDDLRALLTREQTIIAVRRNDLSYQASSIDLSKARFMRVLEVRLLPGREAEFAEAFKSLRAAYAKIKADTPWVVYQVNVGMPTPAFLTFVPLLALKQNDDLLAWRPLLREAQGEAGAKRMDEIAKEAYVSTESNLYVIRPDLSVVFKDFGDSDPDFWFPKPVGSLIKRGPAKDRVSR